MITINEIINDMLDDCESNYYYYDSTNMIGYHIHINENNEPMCFENNGEEITRIDEEDFIRAIDEDCHLNSINEDSYYDIFNEKTYDVVFDSDTSSNSKGINGTYEECMDYIKMYNGTNEGYFEDYKGGVVSIRCNETGEDVYQEIVR